MNTQNPASEFIEEPGYVPGGFGVYYWQGIQLPPFSLDIRAVWMGLVENVDHANFSAAALIWLLLRAGEALEQAKAAKLDVEMTWDHVARIVLRTVRSKEAARMEVMKFLRKEVKTSEKMAELLMLGAKMLDEADKSEPETPADTSSPNAEPEAFQVGKSGGTRKNRRKQK